MNPHDNDGPVTSACLKTKSTSGGPLSGKTIVFSNPTQYDVGLFSQLMGRLDAHRALIISPADEEVALQLLESLRKQGIEAEVINSHPELQVLKEAWGGFEFNGTPGAWARDGLEAINQKITMRREYEYSPDSACYGPEDEHLIKAGRMVPKHHMHLSAHGIPKQRGRKR
jgi:hypothetical protein